jgi:hypothetical protein
MISKSKCCRHVTEKELMITYYSVRKVSNFFLQKPGGFQCGDLEPSYAYVNFFLPFKSISSWQAAFE